MKNVYRITRAENVKFSCQVACYSDFYFRKMHDKIRHKDLFKKELSDIISSELKSFGLQRLFKAYYCGLNCWITCTANPGIKNSPLKAARWILVNKLKTHLGKEDFL